MIEAACKGVDPRQKAHYMPSHSMTYATSRERILEILSRGEIHITGRFQWGSNYTFLAEVAEAGDRLPAVYKPTRGETPLWDFPARTLAKREVAAYLTSEAIHWSLVPPTVLRRNGPAGPGSLQLYVDVDPQQHYFTFSPQEKDSLKPVALFDLLINNADRKGGHIMQGPEGQIWLIDHGVCFHQDFKLRTVVWDFAGKPIPKSLLHDVERFFDRLNQEKPLHEEYADLLSENEIGAFQQRILGVLKNRHFPNPGEGRPYPWPLI
jgi:uncharacterized repeat protein (TIGR03843 family)